MRVHGSADDHTHKIDGWMVKFLLQHDTELGDKPDSALLDNVPPRSSDSTDPSEQRLLSERGRVTRSALSGLWDQGT